VGQWVLFGCGVIVTGMVIALLVGRANEATTAERMVEKLVGSASDPAARVVESDPFSGLPVARYFRYVLAVSV